MSDEPETPSKPRPRRKRHKWQVGDLFAVPLSDGTRKLGQVVAHEKDQFLRSVVCGVTLRNAPEGEDAPASLEAEDFVAVQFVTPDGLTTGDWPVIGRAEVPDLTGLVPPRVLSARVSIGQDVFTSNSLDGFLEACMGLRPWDGMHDPRHYDELLLTPDRKPEGVIYAKASAQKS